MVTVSPEWRHAYAKRDTFLNDVARGNVRETTRSSSYGKVVLSGAANDALIQTQNGFLLVVPGTSGVQMAVVSTSANDSTAGVGIRQVLINYLDANLDPATEIVTLNGITPVNTVATNIRWVQSIVGYTFGANGDAEGDIDITNSGNVYARILTSDKLSKSSIRRVPRDRVLYLSSVFVGASSGTADAKVQVELACSFVGGVSQQASGILYGISGVDLQDNSFSITIDVPLPVPAGEFIGFKCTTDKAATVTAGYTGWLERP